jgi:hypothetical protein
LWAARHRRAAPKKLFGFIQALILRILTKH